MAEAQGDWRSEVFRRKMITQIDEVVRSSNTLMAKSSVEMENHVYHKAKSREEYLALAARLILHIKDFNNQRRERQLMQQAALAGGAIPGQIPSGSGGLQMQSIQQQRQQMLQKQQQMSLQQQQQQQVSLQQQQQQQVSLQQQQQQQVSLQQQQQQQQMSLQQQQQQQVSLQQQQQQQVSLQQQQQQQQVSLQQQQQMSLQQQQQQVSLQQQQQQVSLQQQQQQQVSLQQQQQQQVSLQQQQQQQVSLQQQQQQQVSLQQQQQQQVSLQQQQQQQMSLQQQQHQMTNQQQDDWHTEAFRRKVVTQIDEAIGSTNTPMPKSSVEMENHVYNKAKSREEYMALAARLILHIKDFNKKKRERQQMQQAALAGATNQDQMASGSGGLPTQGPSGMQDPNNAPHNMAGMGQSELDRRDYMKLYEMGMEPERRPFLDRLFAFLEEKGSPITIMPMITKQPVDLYRLYLCVRDKGGMIEVTKEKKWKEICGMLNISGSASAAFTLKKNYIKYLFGFECQFDRGNIDPTLILSQMENDLENRRMAMQTNTVAWRGTQQMQQAALTGGAIPVQMPSGSGGLSTQGPPGMQDPSNAPHNMPGMGQNKPAGIKTRENELEDELERLKDEKMCKVCMDETANMVFMPCSHMATCDNCATSISNCPICRHAILNTIKVFVA